MEQLPLIDNLTPLMLLALVLYFAWRAINKGFDIFDRHLERMSGSLEQLCEKLDDCLEETAIKESLQKSDKEI